MANKYASVLQSGTNNFLTSAEMLNAHATDHFSTGVVGTITNTSGVSPATGSFAVNAQGSPNMTVAVSAGQAYVSATPTGGIAQTVRVRMDAAENVTISANATGGTRYDFVYIKVDADKLNNPAVTGLDAVTLITQRSTTTPTDSNGAPSNSLLLAIVTVANGASSISNSNITDSRIRTGVSSVKGDLELTQSAAASDARINALGADTNIHMALTPKGNGLVKTAVLRQDDTTNTYQKGNTVMLTGWGYMTPGVASAVNETVTFGVTFAQRPVVILTAGGDSMAATTTLGSGIAAVKAFHVEAHTVATTRFIAHAWTTDGTSWAAGNTVYYHWMAIGELA